MLRAVPVIRPAPLVVDDARAMRVYPMHGLRAKWRKAVQWMQQRPDGSIWILDTNRPPPKWRAQMRDAQ